MLTKIRARAARQLARAVRILRIALAVQGSVAIAFGLAAMLWPGLTALVLTYLFAAFLLADGIVMLLLAATYWDMPGGRLRFWWGFLQLLVGVFLFGHPGVALATLLFVLGAALVLRGAFGLAHALASNGDDPGERLLHSVMGMLGIIVGAVVLLQPQAGGLAFVWVLGVYSFVVGIGLLTLSSTIPGLRVTKNKRPPSRK